MIDQPATTLTVRLATTAEDLEAAARLRYDVFVRELGGDHPMVDHTLGLERDRFDPFCHHLVLCDAGGRVVGVYRMLDAGGAARAGGFYSDAEYDLTALRRSGRRLLELGRSCLHPDHRGGSALAVLWRGIARHVVATGAEVLFGVASFPGADAARHAEALALLQDRFRAPLDLRVTARGPCGVPMDTVPAGALDPDAVLRQMPPLVKAYLRIGGVVGDGAWLDHAFNTTDVCLILDVAAMNPRLRARWTRDA